MFRLGQGRAPAAILGPLALVTCVACSQTQTASQAGGAGDDAQPIQAEQVRQEPIRRVIEVVGTLAAEDEVTISAEAEGRVSRILADLGDRVLAGQVLVELDREKLQYSVDQQKAAFARTLAKYGATDADHLPAIEQTPDVQKASAELVQAQQAAERAHELGRRQLLPKQALDDADANLRTKQASYDSAVQNANNLRADIAGSTATVKLAERQLRDASIRAPFDGYVQKRLVALGEYVKMQSPVMSVVRMDPLKVTAEIPEKMAPWVDVGQTVDLRVDAYPDLAVTGKISRISPAVNTTTRAFSFEARVPNEKALLKPGTFARVRIESGKVDQMMTLPYGALQYRYGVNRVFVVNGDRLSAREIKVGDRVGDRIEIVSGVKAGESVATTDIENLVDGMKVSILDAP
jgi:membrane fusion protein, multidrug efflux system